MKYSGARRSRRAVRDDRRRSPARPRAQTGPSVATGNKALNAIARREGAVLGREDSMRLREDATAKENALATREASAETLADVRRLIARMREANGRLVVAAIQAQFVSDDARTEASQAKTEIEQLMDRLQEANEKLVAASEEVRAMEAKARQSEADYRRLSGQLLHLQDEARRRLAQDLHDSTAQHLAALTMNLDLIGAHGLDSSSRRALVESRSLAEHCSREVRTIAYLLHPPLLDESGLVAAIRWYVKGFTERSGIRVEMDLDEPGRLPGPTETALFRVVQESLTNVHRHASSSTARIRLTSSSEAVVLEVHDRGRGLRHDLQQNGALPTLGVGIQGMRERIRQLGGTFHIASTEKGTTVRVRVPLNGGAR